MKKSTLKKGVILTLAGTAAMLSAGAMTEASEPDTLNLSDYSLVWEDNFDAEQLNEADWNIELHEPGWVNNELQEYVNSSDNLHIEDGKLNIKPVKTENEDGTVSYTSGRISTQGKKDFTYGVFEAKIKMPKGKGFLPAFWLMATDENIYGQWPRCGEIDITEVVGEETKTAYSTIHFGNPHKETQGTYTLESGDFSEEFHDFAVEWEPGSIKWYVDGNLMHQANDWYSKTEGVGEITYPAPFDQPFYMILNLAVGGNWPGNPDETTDFENSVMQVEYVKVYQKEQYDENVAKPEKEAASVDGSADETGNYITNADFSEAEDLTDEAGWKFLLANGGQGEASIADNTMTITSTATGDVPYGVQLVHPGIPMQTGAKYRVTFDAWADEARTMETAVTAPDMGWIRYLNDTTVDLTTEKQTFTYDFEVTSENDPNGRMEFNMGNTPSTATIYIQNVRVEMTEAAGETANAKTVLADGNYVYNGSFQEGEQHLGEWEITGSVNTAEVTPLSDGRRLHVAPADETVTVAQHDLALVKDTEYLLAFDAEVAEPAELKITVGDQELVQELTGAANYNLTFTLGSADSTDLTFQLGNIPEIYLDNVRIVENVMIKNGSFSAEFTGYEVYVDSSASATYVVDSLSEDSAADFTIENAGDVDWKIQLKQNNVKLENGKKYRLSVDAKSSIDRSIRILMQGGEDKGWVLYSGENTVQLTSEFQTFTCEFEMTEATDPEAFLSICMGQLEGDNLSETHRVCIDNIVLEEIQ